jgi:hypothetical protein
VYPLRLTGVGNTNCIVELYVFGPGRAQTASFQVVRCETPSYEKRGFWQFTPNADFIRIRHPLLEKIVVNSPVATKLSATLNSASMQKDCYITWIPYQRVRPTYYSHDGATTFAINMLVTTLVTVGLIWLLLHRIEGGWAKWLRKACGWLAVLGVVASLAVYVLLPKVEVTLSRMPVMRMRSTIVQVSSGLAIAWKNERAGRASTNDPDVNWVRQQMAVNSELRRSFSPNFRQNPLTGTDWKEEDSPGNYTLRRNGNLVEVVWYDFNGDEIVESPFESKTAPK